MFKFIHAADVHLDSPLRGLSRYESAPAESIRDACRRAFENLVDLAIEEKVSFVLLAGDLYDGDCPYSINGNNQRLDSASELSPEYCIKINE